jgi:DNA-binding transcriptional ArsR family regulator
MSCKAYAICGILQAVLTTFEVLAQPIRRSLLDRLRTGEQLVGELAGAIGLTQPQTSKHLRVLRDAQLVTVRVDGPRRWYSVRTEPLVELDDWLAPYRWMWEAHLDRLGAHLDTMPDPTGTLTEGAIDDR